MSAYIRYVPIALGGGGGGSGSLTVGALDGIAPSANGLVISASVLYAQSASATMPGLVNTTTQTFAGNKTFSNNASANNFIEGYTTTATTAGTTTLTVTSTFQQFFTGATTQTVTLPVTSTLVNGQSYRIVNQSTGIVTINSSGGNLVQTLPGGSSAIVTVISTSGTTAASWSATVFGNLSVDTFSGDNSTVAFTLAVPSTTNNSQVYVTGVYQFKSTYSISGTTLTFTTAPPTGSSNIQVVSGASAGSSGGGASLPTMADISSVVTPSATAFGTISNYKSYGYVFAGRLWVWGSFQSGTTTGNPALFAISTYSITTSFLQAASVNVLGNWWVAVSGGATNFANSGAATFGPVFTDGSSTTNVWIGCQSGSNALVKNNASDIVISSNTVCFQFSVPAS